MVGKKFVILLGLVAFSYAAKSYTGYKVYNVIPDSQIQVQMLNDLRKQYEFWTDYLFLGQDVRVMVSPEQEQEFLDYVKTAGLNANQTIADVQTLIDAQLSPANIDRSASLGSFTWDRYHNLTTIYSWLHELVELYPGVVTTVNIGRSYEGRFLKAVVIDFKAGQRGEKPLIGMIEGGIHAREWISPATVTWIIKEFLTSTDPDVRFMAESFVWHILPVTNPDGYAYTFEGDRMWKKNRNPANYVPCTPNSDLVNGIDLNRNFDYLWMSAGASANPCDQTYAGRREESERESQALSGYVLNLKTQGNQLYYFAFHSYAQMILIPYSHVAGQDVLQVSNYADIFEISIRGADKLEETHGTRYTVGTSKEILYQVSGSSFDWAKSVAEVPISVLFELRDLGQYGFLLPTDQIIPNNEEIMACLVEMDKTTRQLGYYSSSNSSSSSSAVISSASAVSIALSIVLLVVRQ